MKVLAMLKTVEFWIQCVTLTIMFCIGVLFGYWRCSS